MHPARIGRQHEGRAVCDQQRTALLAHRIGHREDELVAFDRAYQREANAGIAGGRLDDGIAGFDAAGMFGRARSSRGRCDP